MRLRGCGIGEGRQACAVSVYSPDIEHATQTRCVRTVELAPGVEHDLAAIRRPLRREVIRLRSCHGGERRKSTSVRIDSPDVEWAIHAPRVRPVEVAW